MEVAPPSMSPAPTSAPAEAPVTRSPLPPAAASCRLVPEYDVASPVPRSNLPVVAASVPDGLATQPDSASKSSLNTVSPGGGPLPQSASPVCAGTSTAAQAAL